MNKLINKILTLKRQRMPFFADLRLRFKLYGLIFKKNLSIQSLPILLFKTVSMAMLLVIFTMTGIGAYAYTSNSVTTGTKLYPVKLTLEKFEQKINSSDKNMAELHYKFSERRLNEAQYLSTKVDNNSVEKNEELTKTLEDLNDELVNASQHESPETKNISDDHIDEVEKLSEKIDRTDENEVVIKKLTNTVSKIKNENKSKTQKPQGDKNISQQNKINEGENRNTSTISVEAISNNSPDHEENEDDTIENGN